MTLKKNLTNAQRTMLIAVLNALKAHGCITSYTINGDTSEQEWSIDGFDRAFEELKTNRRPFGLKKGERGWLVLVLEKKNKKAISDFLDHGFAERGTARGTD
jgi:hypothetical protein